MIMKKVFERLESHLDLFNEIKDIVKKIIL